jgi:hypothetical protein
MFPPDLTIDSSSTQLHDAQWDFCGIEWMGTGFPPDLTIDSSSTQLHDAQWDFCGIEWMGPVTTLPCGCAPAWHYFIVHLCASINRYRRLQTLFVLAGGCQTNNAY